MEGGQQTSGDEGDGESDSSDSSGRPEAASLSAETQNLRGQLQKQKHPARERAERLASNLVTMTRSATMTATTTDGAATARAGPSGRNAGSGSTAAGNGPRPANTNGYNAGGRAGNNPLGGGNYGRFPGGGGGNGNGSGNGGDPPDSSDSDGNGSRRKKRRKHKHKKSKKASRRHHGSSDSSDVGSSSSSDDDRPYKCRAPACRKRFRVKAKLKSHLQECPLYYGDTAQVPWGQVGTDLDGYHVMYHQKKYEAFTDDANMALHKARWKPYPANWAAANAAQPMIATPVKYNFPFEELVSLVCPAPLSTIILTLFRVFLSGTGVWFATWPTPHSRSLACICSRMKVSILI